mmetsp:Transcript_23160/g.44116  ORF Transcript_23160/g.44116 Transcript_23160/m.44116 type:complete len:207 (-) Transcript_23160:164-784(-)|eukprot:scaffold19392_cov221-Amphora_coffeaeformis.AAC.4
MMIIQLLRRRQQPSARSKSFLLDVMTFLLAACLSVLPSHAFVATPVASIITTRWVAYGDTSQRSSSSSLAMMIPSMHSTSLQLAEVESWRQYVPLAVSLLVITDILLGSPAANAALSVLRPPEDSSNGNETAGSNKKSVAKDVRERIDTMAIAQQALDKASATTELRRFLDESKSDMDKMRDVQKKLDAQLQEFDAKQQAKKKEEN